MPENAGTGIYPVSSGQFIPGTLNILKKVLASAD
jgi:hypothetical protein